MSQLPTVKVASDAPEGYTVINAQDFDPAKHTAYVEGAPAKKGAKAKAAPASEPASEPAAE